MSIWRSVTAMGPRRKTHGVPSGESFAHGTLGPMPEPARPLAHIKVIDLTRARSGPTCVRQLSEMGAKVIKVEAPDTEDDGTGARHEYDFQNLHPNKRSISLNLKSDQGRDILIKMVKESDVLVE